MNVNKIINDIFKIILNIILFAMAAFTIVNVFTSNDTLGSICYRLLIAILCIATIFSKKYRYIGLTLILLLMCISYLITK